MKVADALRDACLAVKHLAPNQAIGTGIILGSGLSLPDALFETIVRIPYADIPHFPQGNVAGHQGELLVGTLPGQDKAIALLKGRVHYYEGHTPSAVVFPVRLLKTLGATTLIVTNAAGGLQTGMQAGDLMLIRDHLNLMGMNPLIGPNDDDIGPRFPDMSRAYCPALRQKLLDVAQREDIALKQGVYAGLSGPCYETPAEIRMLSILGADAVGMSTVPEVIAANHAGMAVLGISMISNLAAGLVEGHTLSHEEVLATGKTASDTLAKLLARYLIS